MILQRYVLKDLLMVFLLSMAAITLIFIVVFLFQTLRSYEQLGLGFAMEFIVIALGSALPYIIPIAATMAATFVFSRLSAHNELLAMKASGIHIQKIVAPAILFGLGLSLVSLFFYQIVTPHSYHARRVAIRSAVRSVLKSPPPDTSSKPVGNYRISYQEFSDGLFQLPLIIELDDRGQRTREYQALSARIVWDAQNNPEVVMEDTTIRTFENGKQVSESTGERSKIKGKLIVDDPRDFEKKPAGMSSEELLIMARTHPEPHQRNRAMFEYYARYARSAAPLVLVLLGLVVGTMVTKGTKLVGLGSSLPILVVYFLFTMVNESMTDSWKLPVAVLACLPLGLMSFMGLYPFLRLYRA